MSKSKQKNDEGKRREQKSSRLTLCHVGTLLYRAFFRSEKTDIIKII